MPIDIINNINKIDCIGKNGSIFRRSWEAPFSRFCHFAFASRFAAFLTCPIMGQAIGKEYSSGFNC